MKNHAYRMDYKYFLTIQNCKRIEYLIFFKQNTFLIVDHLSTYEHVTNKTKLYKKHIFICKYHNVTFSAINKSFN